MSTTYYALGDIKDKLHIDDTDQDSQIARLGEQADAYINTQLSIHAVVAIPFPENELRALSNKLAAAEYLTWNSPDHPRALYDSARKDIQEYIKAIYGKQNADGFTNNTFSKTSSAITGL
jgi:hypothetical protein